MTLREQNYWLTTVEMPKTDRLAALPESVDVAVIGGGFTGLSAARILAKQGAEVAVLEAESIGWGASSRNGGMVLTGLKLGANKLISMYGRETTQRMYAASITSIDCVEKIVREEGIDCDFSRCGHLEVACKQKHFDDYARQVADVLIGKNIERATICGVSYGGLIAARFASHYPSRCETLVLASTPRPASSSACR